MDVMLNIYAIFQALTAIIIYKDFLQPSTT